MEGNNNSKSPNGGRKTEDKHSSLKRVVLEGSTVNLDVRDLVKNIDNIDSIKYYSWKQTAGIHIDIDDVKDKPNFSFIAPYVNDNDLNYNAITNNKSSDTNTPIPPAYAELSFRLTITENDAKTKVPPYDVDIIVKRVQRAVIFQGGVALGAYEAGVFRAIVEKLTKNDEDKKRKGLDTEKRPLFDIVAGTSIGGMNAAIVVSTIIKKNEGKSLEDPENWKDSAEKVIKFWKYQEQLPTYADLLDTNPFYHNSWDIMHNTSKVFKDSFAKLMEFYSNIIDPDLKQWYENTVINWSMWEPTLLMDYIVDGWYIPAAAEAARRYYSAKQFLRFNLGPFHVASGIYPWFAFGKFFDFLEQPNYMPRPDNKHYVSHSLKRTLERFADFPIKTSPIERKEPRLLLVTVDVKTGDAVTFDSYSPQTGYHDNKNTISNPNGIEIDHALATGTFPDFFDYPKFKVQMDGKNNEEQHIFWDGGFRSNTPLREVLQAHRDYWLRKAKERERDTKQSMQVIDESDEIGKKEEEKHYNEKYDNVVPDLEIYIVDLWPSELKEDPISFDRDFVANKEWNLILDGKTDYDEQVASVITDYIDLTRRLKNLAEQKGASTKEINHILNSKATSINTIGKRRIYGELLEGRFRLTKVVHVDRMDDGNEVNDKVFDYSYRTVEELMNVGYRDASVQMDLQQIKDGIMELAKRNSYRDMKEGDGNNNSNNHQIQKLEENIDQIQEAMKVQNGYNDNTIEQVEKFIDKIEKIGEVLPKEEKVSLIAAAERLQDTLHR